MEFRISAEALNPALTYVSNVVEQQQLRPILGNIALVAEGQHLNLDATDLQVSLHAQVDDVEVVEEGSVLVQPRKFVGVVRQIGDAPQLTLKSYPDTDSAIEVRYGRSRFKMQTMPPDEFPAHASQAADILATVPVDDFKEMVVRAEIAMAQTDVRYYLNGICLVVTESKLEVAATDASKMSVSTRLGECTGLSDGEVKQVIVPSKAVASIRRLLDLVEGDCQVEIGEKHASIRGGQYSLSTSLIEHRYPDYMGVVVKEEDVDWKMRGDRDALLSAARRAVVLANETDRGIRFEVSGDTAVIKSNNMYGDESEVHVEVDGLADSHQTTVNGDFLVQILERIGGGEIEFSVPKQNRRSRGIKMVNVGKDDFFFLLSSLRRD